LGSAPVAGTVNIVDDTNSLNCLEGAATGTQMATSPRGTRSRLASPPRPRLRPAT
jgi:hypothetical protein